MRIMTITSVSVVTLAFLSAQARANGLPPDGGTIIGTFSNVGTSGYIIHDPTLLAPPVYFDNSGTAVYSITNSTDPTLVGSPSYPGGPYVQATGSKLQWGTYSPGLGVPPEDWYSQLIFFGGKVPSNIHDPFTAGVITFLNGTSTLNTLIFSADLNLYDTYVSPETYLGTDKIIITTTSNLNAGYPGELPQDADYINICGNGSNICNSSVEAWEDSQGGTGVTAVLSAQIVGDPQLQFTDAALAPGQNPYTSGLIGTQSPLGTAVPEPATWAMLIAGFSGLSLVGYRKAKTGAVAA